jgi:hypothetical protein
MDASGVEAMDTASLILALVVLLVALVATAGGIAALIMQKVVVNEAGQVTEIEIPVLGKFRTNYPSIAAVAIGTILAYGVLHTMGMRPETIPITAKILLDHPSHQLTSDVFVGVIPQRYQVWKAQVRTSEEKDIKILVDKAPNYQVIVYTVTGIDPVTGYAEKVVVNGVPDENNVFDAILKLHQ